MLIVEAAHWSRANYKLRCLCCKLSLQSIKYNASSPDPVYGGTIFSHPFPGKEHFKIGQFRLGISKAETNDAGHFSPAAALRPFIEHQKDIRCT
jgi:hypothetical protein